MQKEGRSRRSATQPDCRQAGAAWAQRTQRYPAVAQPGPTCSVIERSMLSMVASDQGPTRSCAQRVAAAERKRGSCHMRLRVMGRAGRACLGWPPADGGLQGGTPTQQPGALQPLQPGLWQGLRRAPPRKAQPLWGTISPVPAADAVRRVNLAALGVGADQEAPALGGDGAAAGLACAGAAAGVAGAGAGRAVSGAPPSASAGAAAALPWQHGGSARLPPRGAPRCAPGPLSPWRSQPSTG